MPFATTPELPRFKARYDYLSVHCHRNKLHGRQASHTESRSLTKYALIWPEAGEESLAISRSSTLDIPKMHMQQSAQSWFQGSARLMA